MEAQISLALPWAWLSLAGSLKAGVESRGPSSETDGVGLQLLASTQGVVSVLWQ